MSWCGWVHALLRYKNETLNPSVFKHSARGFPLKCVFSLHSVCLSGDVEGRAIDNYRIVTTERVERDSVCSEHQCCVYIGRTKNEESTRPQERKRQLFTRAQKASDASGTLLLSSLLFLLARSFSFQHQHTNFSFFSYSFTFHLTFAV